MSVEKDVQTCDRCKKSRAVVYREHSGLKLCRNCFIKEVETKVRKTISRFKMLDRGDRIALAVSGGKDSLAMVEILIKNYSQFFEFHRSKGLFPVAITIDEGIKGYRAESIKLAMDICKKHDLNHVIFSFKDEFGLSLDEIIGKVNASEFSDIFNFKHPAGQLKNAGKIILKPCSICGVLRRRLINDIAERIGATKIATGHNLNDEIETFLMNVFRGDVNRIIRAGSLLFEHSPFFLKKIKPLRLIPQKDIVLYLYYSNGFFQEQPCPYSEITNILRADVQKILINLENNYAGVIFNIGKFMDLVYTSFLRNKKYDEFSTCENCGKPKSKNLQECMACFYSRRIFGKNYKDVVDRFINRLSLKFP
ncbi:MAG: hypothetical protein ACTSWN_04205 [Promethearchaeota archaeon]